jgi:hypothetical protein
LDAFDLIGIHAIEILIVAFADTGNVRQTKNDVILTDTTALAHPSECYVRVLPKARNLTCSGLRVVDRLSCADLEYSITFGDRLKAAAKCSGDLTTDGACAETRQGSRKESGNVHFVR